MQGAGTQLNEAVDIKHVRRLLFAEQKCLDDFQERMKDADYDTRAYPIVCQRRDESVLDEG